MGESRIYGYARVSSIDQSLDRQIDALLKAGVAREFIREDKQSGKNFDRLAYQYLKTELRQGDTLIVKELDRLGRNYEGIKREWQELSQKGVYIAVLDMPVLDTRQYRDGMDKVITNIVLELLSYIAQNEREKIRQRQAEGISIAKAKGKHLGRPPISEPEGFNEVYRQWKAGKLTAVQSMQKLGLKKNSFYRMAKNRASLSETK